MVVKILQFFVITKTKVIPWQFAKTVQNDFHQYFRLLSEKQEISLEE
jgi:hypothetical protein